MHFIYHAIFEKLNFLTFFFNFGGNVCVFAENTVPSSHDFFNNIITYHSNMLMSTTLGTVLSVYPLLFDVLMYYQLINYYYYCIFFLYFKLYCLWLTVYRYINYYLTFYVLMYKAISRLTYFSL